MTMTQQELESYLWGAANLLRGVIDPGDYKSIIFPLMFFKRLSDVYDEECEEAVQTYGDEESAKFIENHMFQIPDGSHWQDVRKTSTNIGKALRIAMLNIEKANPDKLTGIFGDTNWSNKDRLSDRILADLIEHFSSLNLSLINVRQDEFGNAYEYLIKKFADDCGHSAAEFYTNRTVVRLMTLIVDPQPGESIYDPTCGSGGMLLNARLLVKEHGKEYRSLKLHGQEINLITSSIARMNMFIHGVQDFNIMQGDTLRRPIFIENGAPRQFDICIANPPYSVNEWDNESWINDPWGRNTYGVPPKGNADYAFFQHILSSLKKDTGRCAILYPNGVLERDAEAEIRKRIVEQDLVECVIGLGKDFFYNSTMESCIVICRTKKGLDKKGKILFIDAKDEFVRIDTQNFLSDASIAKIFSAYTNYTDIPDFAKVASLEEIKANECNLNIRFYVKDKRYLDKELLETPYETYLKKWVDSRNELEKSMLKVRGMRKELC
jgi:type I restriction enzyme M protein